jgi:hypothetical protein
MRFGIPNPTGRKKELGLNYVNSQMKGNDYSWSFTTINGILKNEVYLGHLIQGRHRMMSHKIHKHIQVPEEDWIIVENTHEPIIDEETFYKVQELLERNTRTPRSQPQVYMLAGFIKCADCGRAMNKKHIAGNNKNYFYYVCNTYKKRGKAFCTKHTIRTDVLEKAILDAIKIQINLSLRFEKVLETINKSSQRNTQNNSLQIQLNKKLVEQEKIVSLKKSIYEDWKSGVLSKEEFFDFKKKYDEEAEEIETIIQNLKLEQEKYKETINSENEWIMAFKKNKNITKLTREVVVELIDQIYVHENSRITIKFKFADEYERILNYIEENEFLQEKVI